MNTLNQIFEAISAHACYLNTFNGVRWVKSFNDSTGWVVTNNTGNWLDDQSYMVCQSDLMIDPLKLALYREEHVEQGSCPACNASDDVTVGVDLFACRVCGCLHGQVYLGDSYGIVKPQMTSDPEADKRARPFDLTCLGGSKGITRRHGWFDPETRLMTQVG